MLSKICILLENTTRSVVFSMKLLAEKAITSSDYKIYILLLDMSKAFDTVNRNQLQTRHNFVGEIRIFSVKICLNPYPSFMHRCIAKTFMRFISRCSLHKIATLCNKNRPPATKNQNRSFTSRGATVGLGLRL